MSRFLHSKKNETRTSHSWKVIKKINKNFNSTKTLYLQGKPRIFWKIKKKEAIQIECPWKRAFYCCVLYIQKNRAKKRGKENGKN